MHTKEKKTKMEPEFLTCSYDAHRASGSIYPKDKIPIELFHRKTKDGGFQLLKTCLDCRTYINISKTKTRSKRKQNVQHQLELIEKELSEFGYCPNEGHAKISEYPRDKVPIILFRKIQNNPKSELAIWCFDCRTVSNENKTLRKYAAVEKAREKGLFFCPYGHHDVELDRRCMNKDGSPGSVCKECRIKEKARKSRLVKSYNTIKFEMMKKSQSSCVRCNYIYLKPDQNTLTPIAIETFLDENNGKRFFVYEEEKHYTSCLFDLGFEHFEMGVVELDHLTEKEQRERGLLKPEEIFVPKKGDVSHLDSEHAQRLEALKTQNLCCKCHIEITMEREKGNFSDGITKREKRELAESIKSQGCTSCGYVNMKIPRFFHFDHIDPKKKSNNICTMITTTEITIYELIEELKQTRVLCGHCHVVRTRYQREEKLKIEN